MEDLNYLYYRQQVSLMRADEAACACSRWSHLGLARGYSARIAALPVVWVEEERLAA